MGTPINPANTPLCEDSNTYTWWDLFLGYDNAYYTESKSCTVWKSYMFHQVVWIADRFLLASLAKLIEQSSILALIDIDEDKMKILCNKKSPETLRFCDIKQYGLITRINGTLLIMPKVAASVREISAYSSNLHGK